MNSFMSNLSNATNYGMTWNGELSHKSTMNPIYDMFATGGAYRKRNDDITHYFLFAIIYFIV